MAFGNEGPRQTFLAQAAMTATEYRFVIPGTNAGYCVVAGANGRTIGIRQNTAAIDTEVSVQIYGIAKLTLGDTVTKGGALKSDSAGAGVPVASNNDHVGGIALDSGVSGDVISVLIANYQYGV